MPTDVLIVGAGPAGSTLARQLALQGFDVLLTDKKSFPRHKPCGEFLSPECLPYLEALGLGELLTGLGAHSIEGMRLHGQGRLAHGHFLAGPDAGWRSRGFGVRRERFDLALLDAARAAGARVETGQEFVALTRDHDGVVDGATLQTARGEPSRRAARWVIGADGVHSRVARSMGVQHALSWLDQFALVAHFAGVPVMPTAEVHLLHSGFFAATTVDAGIFSVNLVIPRDRLRQRATRNWDEFVASHFVEAPRLAPRLDGARRLLPWRGVGPLAFRTEQVAIAGAALVGDAAGYVDPLTGEGIYFALFGAQKLGVALAEALHDPQRGAAAMRQYAATRRREIAPRLFVSRLLQRGLRHPWVVRTMLRGLSRWPRLTDLLVTMSGDTIHPRDLWRPTFWRQFRRSA